MQNAISFILGYICQVDLCVYIYIEREKFVIGESQAMDFSLFSSLELAAVVLSATSKQDKVVPRIHVATVVHWRFSIRVLAGITHAEW